MIYLIAFRVMVSPNGARTKFKVPFKEPIKWENDFNEFNIFDPKAWRDYLANKFKLPNGLPLPNKHTNGEDLVYYVYMYGTSKEAQEYFGKKSGKNKEGGALLSLFPGYDKDGNKRDILTYGRIRLEVNNNA